jgi:cytoskeleton protein RodZ
VEDLEDQSPQKQQGKASCAEYSSDFVLGGWLAKGRVASGHTLETLSGALRVQQFYLDALEREDFSVLPARPYVSGYVRSYAIRIGFDPREANQRLNHVWRDKAMDVPVVAALRFSDPPTSARRKFRGGLAAMAVLMAGASYATWYFETVRDREPTSLSPVAALEGDNAPEAGRDDPTSVASDVPRQSSESGQTVVLGPLSPVSVRHLPDDYVDGFLKSQAEEAEADQFEALPAGAFPRPRPDTPASAAWLKLYGKPKLPAHEQDQRAAVAVRSDALLTNGLPSGSSLNTYLPKLRLRADLGPLDAELPLLVSLPRRGEVEVPEAVAPEPIFHARTQAFAAVPPQVRSNFSREADAPEARVILRAVSAASWIEIRDARGEVVMSRLLKAGQSVPVPNQPGLVLTTGNAGALEVVVDGVLLPALGRDRAVVRGVPLDPASLKDRLG